MASVPKKRAPAGRRGTAAARQRRLALPLVLAALDCPQINPTGGSLSLQRLQNHVEQQLVQHPDGDALRVALPRSTSEWIRALTCGSAAVAWQVDRHYPWSNKDASPAIHWRVARTGLGATAECLRRDRAADRARHAAHRRVCGILAACLRSRGRSARVSLDEFLSLYGERLRLSDDPFVRALLHRGDAARMVRRERMFQFNADDYTVQLRLQRP